MAEVPLSKRIEAIERRLKEAALLPAVQEDATLQNIIIGDVPFLLTAIDQAIKQIRVLESNIKFDPGHSDK